MASSAEIFLLLLVVNDDVFRHQFVMRDIHEQLINQEVLDMKLRLGVDFLDESVGRGRHLLVADDDAVKNALLAHLGRELLHVLRRNSLFAFDEVDQELVVSASVGQEKHKAAFIVEAVEVLLELVLGRCLGVARNEIS